MGIGAIGSLSDMVVAVMNWVQAPEAMQKIASSLASGDTTNSAPATVDGVGGLLNVCA